MSKCEYTEWCTNKDCPLREDHVCTHGGMNFGQGLVQWCGEVERWLKCIPYEPEGSCYDEDMQHWKPQPPACSECGHPAHRDKCHWIMLSGEECKCKPADQPAEQPKPQPAPQMPLNECLANLEDEANDMAAHDAAIAAQARREFAEKIDAWIEKQNWRLTSEWGLCSSTIRNTIDAMAKE